MGRGNSQGADGFKIGNLKRQLETLPLVVLDPLNFPPESLAGTITQRVWLRGLQGNLKVLIACGVSDGTSLPYSYPLAPGTIQLYPTTHFGDCEKVLLRPVFQDPTNVLNVNAPLPQQIPFGWEGSFTEVDEIMIEVVIPGFGAVNSWVGFGSSGTIVLQATVEYNGAWWDVDALTYALGNVQWSGVPLITIGTKEGGG